MSASGEETICALATATGGAVAIIRISGAGALAAASRVWHGAAPLSRASARRLCLGTAIGADGPLDPQCLAVYMPGPHSYTGEDVCELHLHGGPLVAKLRLRTLEAMPDVRGARPGEFTRRAFLNGKLDLTQAEAVADLLRAESEAALALAGRQLAGALGQTINALYDELHELLAEVESRLDFPEEEIDWMPLPELQERLARLRDAIADLADTRREGEALRDGVTLAIAGAPNVGKSSLLNRLLGRDRAIVSPVAGTTRDTIEADFVLRNIPLRLVDTAGIHHAADAIEADGISRARKACEEADLVLWLADATAPPWPGWPIHGALIRVASKADLLAPAQIPDGAIPVSARTGAGLDHLADAIESAVLRRPPGQAASAVAVSARHAALLDRAADSLDTLPPLLDAAAWELAAIPLRQALAALGEITGRAVSPDILDTIFHRFCIGK